MGPLLSVRLQTALHPDAERAAALFAASEAANDGRRLVGGPDGGMGGSGEGGGTGYYYAGAGMGGQAYHQHLPPPMQDNPMLDILQGAHERLYSRLFIS